LQIAELLIIIQDYEGSISYLKQIVYELKDKSYRHYVNIIELLTICNLHLLNLK